MIDVTKYFPKTEKEIESIKKAQSITDQAFERVLKKLKEGITELEVAAELEKEILALGGDGLAFDTIAAFGESAIDPHAVPSLRKLKAGDFVMMDFGAMVDGYCSDMTRTVACKKVTEKQRHIYNAVLDAQIKTIDKLQIGAISEEIHCFCKSVLDSHGYGKYFIHGTGHGVGREIHEAPSLSRYEKNLPEGMTLESYKGTPLIAGTVVTVEPGVYYRPFIGKKIGVRIEDMILLTQSGKENLTKSPKELIIIE